MTDSSHVSTRSAESPVVFRRGILPTVLRAIVVSAVALTAALFLIPQIVPRGMSLSDRTLLLTFVAVVLLVVVWGTLFWLRNVRVVVSRDVVEIGRPGSREAFERATTEFRSRVTEHRTNGVRSGTTRTLIVGRNGVEREFELPGFSRAAFNELMAQLIPLAIAHPADPVAAARVRSQVRRDFQVDASRERRLAIVFAIVSAVFLLLTLVIVLSVMARGELDGESVAILLTPLTGLVAAGFGLGVVQRVRAVRQTPTRITVGHRGLRLDEVEHPYASLTRIWLTPPSYSGAKRLRLERRGGRPLTLTLSAPRITLDPDYDELVTALRSETAAFPGLLSLDLE